MSEVLFDLMEYAGLDPSELGSTLAYDPHHINTRRPRMQETFDLIRKKYPELSFSFIVDYCCVYLEIESDEHGWAYKEGDGDINTFSMTNEIPVTAQVSLYGRTLASLIATYPFLDCRTIYNCESKDGDLLVSLAVGTVVVES